MGVRSPDSTLHRECPSYCLLCILISLTHPRKNCTPTCIPGPVGGCAERTVRLSMGDVRIPWTTQYLGAAIRCRGRKASQRPHKSHPKHGPKTLCGLAVPRSRVVPSELAREDGKVRMHMDHPIPPAVHCQCIDARRRELHLRGTSAHNTIHGDGNRQMRCECMCVDTAVY